MEAQIIFFIVSIASGIYVLAPLFSGKGKININWESGRKSLEQLYAEKERLYSNISELDFDYATGKIEKKEYEKSRNGLMKETAYILEKIEKAKKGKTKKSRVLRAEKRKSGKKEETDSMDTIEREIKRLKKKRRERQEKSGDT